MAFGDCLLLLQREYDIYYQIKEERVGKFQDSEEVPDASWMIPIYRRAIAFKQTGDLGLLTEMDLVEEWLRTREYWLRYFLWFEGNRLGVQLNSSEDYCREIALRERRELRSLLRNFHLLGASMAYPTADWIWIHPRNRLYAALHFLLGGREGHELLKELLGTNGNAAERIERFYAIRSRLA